MNETDRVIGDRYEVWSAFCNDEKKLTYFATIFQDGHYTVMWDGPSLEAAVAATRDDDIPVLILPKGVFPDAYPDETLH